MTIFDDVIYDVTFFNLHRDHIQGRLITKKVINKGFWFWKKAIKVEETSEKFICSPETDELFYGENSGLFHILVQEVLFEELKKARIKKQFEKF